MKKEITWTLSNGKESSVTVELTTMDTVWADGHEVEIAKTELHIVAEVEDHGIIGSGEPVAIDNPAAAARIGNLGIPAEQLDHINAAIAEMKASPEWQAKQAATEAAIESAERYEEGRMKMREVMGY